MYDIITVGSATVDVFVNTDSELIRIKSTIGEKNLIAYPAGTKLIIKNLNFTIGGGGTNTAVAFSRLGFKVGYLGKLGKDDNANHVLELLRKEKIDFLGARGAGQTGYSVVLDSLEHDRTILTYKGVNNLLSMDDINLNKLKTEWFYFSSMVGKSFKTLEKLAAFASKKGIKIAFNPSSYQAKKGIKYLLKVLKKINILILNKEEAQYLVGEGRIDFLIKELKAFFALDLIVITEGKKGAYAYDGTTFFHLIPRKTKVIESTGAGDAFASSFVHGYMKKKDIPYALRLGQTNAESVLKHFGAKNNLLTKRGINKKFGKYQVKKKQI